MITADQLKILTTRNAVELTHMAKDKGYKGPAFSSCRFLGMTNGGQFCYMAVFLVNPGKSADTDSTKVYVTFNAGKMTAEVDRTEVWNYN